MVKSYQLFRFKQIVKHAYLHSPYYRRIYDEHGIKYSEIKCLEDVGRFPSISKAALIDHRNQISSNWKFISGTKTTGGSTGQPVCIRKNPGALARERAATWRAYEWAGVEVGDRQARFWGVPHSFMGKIKVAVTDLIANRLRLSAFNLTESSLNLYCKKIKLFKPCYLYGYVSVIKVLADFIRQNDLPPIPSLKCIITTSEVLTESAAREIYEVFGCRVFNEYGCGEVGSIAHECEKGNLHIMADNLYVEIEKKDGLSGEILVTDFFNLAMPLIRYRLGDYALAGSEICSCGRGLPIIKSVHGRAYDLIKTPSGKSIHPEAAIYIFESMQEKTGAFKQFQVIQTEINKIIVKVVPSSDWDDTLIPVLIQNLEYYLDDQIKYEINVCEKIERENSGKMRLVKNMII
jgi:phenylacetate-CoA ligase